MFTKLVVLFILCPFNWSPTFSGVETFGKNAVVIGRSKNVGMPIAMLLHADGIGETNACKKFHLFTPCPPPDAPLVI